MKKHFSFFLCLMILLCLMTSCGKSTPEDIADYSSCDIDLTQFSTTMAYAEVYEIRYSPEDYLGKTIRLCGKFSASQSPEGNSGDTFFACQVTDVAACCSVEVRFDLEDNLVYPDDYPDLGSDIIVCGIYEEYDRNGYTSYHLARARLE